MRIVYFAPIAYAELKQRSQYIAEYLAKEHQVVYVEPTWHVEMRLLLLMWEVCQT